MNCEQIQPDLLDYAKGLLSGSEARGIRAHIQKCPECAAVLRDEVALSAALAAIPSAAPVNDVWALIRAGIKPKAFRVLAWLAAMLRTPAAVRRGVAAVATVALATITLCSFRPEPPTSPEVTPRPSPSVTTVRWADDPLGDHTDAMVKVIDNM